MLERSEEKTFHESPVTARILWVAMLATLVIYAVIGETFGRHLAQDSAAILPIRTLFYGIAIAIFPLMNLLRRTMAARPAAGACRRYLAMVAVSMALAETIAVLGLTLLMLGDTRRTFYIFIGIASIAMVLYRPQGEEYRRLGFGEGKTK